MRIIKRDSLIPWGCFQVAKKTKNYKVIVKEEYCKACGLCIEFCKQEVLAESGKLNQMGYDYATPVNPEACNGCAVCALVCPDLAIEIYYE